MKNHGHGTTERVRSCVKRMSLGGMCVRISLINLLIILFVLVLGGNAACCFMSPLEASRCPCGSCRSAPPPPCRSPGERATKRCSLPPARPRGRRRGEPLRAACPPRACSCLWRQPPLVCCRCFPRKTRCGVRWGPLLGWRGSRQTGACPAFC